MTVRICIVGAGPRGTVALERICANAPALTPGIPVEVNVVDPYPPGSGRVWNPGQPRDLLMNTVASDVTVFTDSTVRCDGPLSPGPTQFQWARMVADGRMPGASREARAEAATMQPWSYASRAFQGEYLNWSFRHIVGRAPAQVTVRVHQARAVAVGDLADGRQEVRLESGTPPLLADAVILAQGHYDVSPGRREQEMTDFARRHGLRYVPPSSPAEASLDGIRAGEPVIMRGLGLSFYDYMILLTEGRGGRFIREDDRLRYLPSGSEPVLHAGSGRGMPYQARAETRQEVVPRYRPDFLTATEITRLRAGAGSGCTDFLRHLLPLLSKEVAWVYYQVLLAETEPQRLARLLAEFPGYQWGSAAMEKLLADLVPDAARRWNWEALDRPADDRQFASPAAFRAWLTEQVREDLRQARLGPRRSAAKAASAAMRDLRDEIRQVVSHRGISGSSYRDHVDGWFSGLNNYLSSGPPASRIEQLLALVDAGIVEPVGPGMAVTADERAGAFMATSARVAGARVLASALVDARLPATDIRRAADPLLASMRASGQCRAHVIPNAGGDAGYETGGLDVTETTFQVIDANGSGHPARFSYGPPTESVEWVTAIGARPHVNSRTLQHGDSIARASLLHGAARLAPQSAATEENER